MTTPPADSPTPSPDTTPEPRRRRWRAIAGSVIGLLLVAAAVGAVAIRHQDLAGSWQALTRAPWWMVLLALTFPITNWAVVALALWVITAKHGPVRAREMMALVAGAWLLNYLPMRPGMLGRIAYHRAVNGIPVKTSMGLLVLSMGLTATAIAILAGLSLSLRWAGSLATEATIVIGAGLLIGVSILICRATGGPWRLAVALLLRYIDMLVWVARYTIVFHLVGQRLTFEQACAIAAVSQAATAIPLSGNGLGLREWAVALTAGALPAWFGGAVTGAPAGSGEAGVTVVALAADLVNRGIEMLVAVPVGLAGMGMVARRLRRAARERAGASAANALSAERVGRPEPEAPIIPGSEPLVADLPSPPKRQSPWGR